MLFSVNPTNWITFFSAVFAQVLLMLVAGLTLCCTSTHHQPEFLCAAPQLLIALRWASNPLLSANKAAALTIYATYNAITVEVSSPCLSELLRALLDIPACSCAEGYRMITS